jgi:outer membrane protein TolC
MGMLNRFVWSLIMLFGLPVALAAQQPFQLSLRDAVDAALEPGGNTRIQIAREAIRQAEARAAQARAALLPDISASVGQQNRTQSLTAFGLRSESLPGEFQFPGTVGPYNTFDARATFSQKLFDLSSIRRYQAARIGTQAAKEDTETAREQTAAEAALAYLEAVRGQALVETEQANVELSVALVALAQSQKEA